MTAQNKIQYPKVDDPDYENKLRAYHREYQRRHRSTPEGQAQIKAAKARYRAKPGVRKRERAGARDRIRRLSSTVKGRAHLRDLSFKSHHGVTREEANELAAKQKNLCAICRKPPQGKRHHSRLHVDHSKKTGEVRGMLCAPCNMGLGLLGHSIKVLRAAIGYLS